MRVDQFVFRDLVYLPVTFMRGQDVSGNLRRLLSTERQQVAARRQQQEQRLASLIESAMRNCPEYEVRLAHLNLNRVTLESLQDVPTLSKKELRDRHASLTHINPPRLCVDKTTGGSTGEPVTVKKTRTAMAWELAATWRGYSWAGVHMGDRQARFWGVPLTSSGRRKAQLIDFVCHRQRFSAFSFDRRSFEQFDRLLRRKPPDYFYGYVSMIAELARWYTENGKTLPKPPRAIITTSEVLTPDDRATIERAFSSRVYNEYGCGELGTVAHECEEGRLHISEENMVLEILDGDRRCRPGEKGEIVVTELTNVAMPLIRYRTGDFGVVSDETCPCGRTLGVLESVAGRAYDFIVAPDGRKYHAEFLVYIFEEAQRQDVGIAQFRVEQLRVDELRALVVPAASGFSAAHEARLVSRMKQLLGDSMKVNVSRVASIPRERSGKMRVIVGLAAIDAAGAPAPPLST